MLPVSIERVASSSDAITVGVDQVKSSSVMPVSVSMSLLPTDAMATTASSGRSENSPVASWCVFRVLYGEPGP